MTAAGAAAVTAHMPCKEGQSWSNTGVMWKEEMHDRNGKSGCVVVCIAEDRTRKVKEVPSVVHHMQVDRIFM